MAKSPVGGSRAYLKGRIGSDVYSLGKDGKGKRQQIVRALAEQVANPRTAAQMGNRMIMATVMQAAKFFGFAIDHSFDGVPAGQPSISKFIKLNYALLSDKAGAYNSYQEKGLKFNPYIISQGKAQLPSGMYQGQNQNDDSSLYGKWGIWIKIMKPTVTVADIKAIMQSASMDDYLTVVDADDNNIVRYSVNPAAADDTVLTTSNANDIFKSDVVAGTANIEVIDAGSGDDAYWEIGFGMRASQVATGEILSIHKDGKWLHTSCQLRGASAVTPNWDAALATYPQGTEQFLNGGDL